MEEYPSRYVVGSKPYANHIKAVVLRLWKTKPTLQIFCIKNGYFFSQFYNGEDCDGILQKGATVI